MNTLRTLRHVIPSVATSDGAGVKLRRSIGSQRGLYLDPFLMLDEFYSDDPNDYLAGFPAHPHRGFETVTYMLDGHMQHQDHLGNTGDLGPGSVQWMTAARGIIHSEMPQQREGRMRGFQLWLNLPAAEKMKPAEYRDIPSQDVPTVTLAGGVSVRVIAGTLIDGERHIDGPVSPQTAKLSTDPLYFDVRLPAGSHFEQKLADTRSAFVYVYEGEARIAGRPLPNRAAGALDAGDTVRIDAGADGARVLLLAARPLHEPIVQYGPFVMNTRDEIEQAIQDYQSGAFGKAA
ncbi:pirin family protein [Solimonas terrae]|uniref:Pirin family protein n=1 Tax=Solimonas terrae TaxID=1396819 RepID=A0A6M2BRC7_9GAMM|nr:pirin family protein [Solimonas terrae]NGY05146.1 pirin family protein [Solimonas terrae]